ncbi:MAG TPA: MarR family transcriptional regulator [Mycobacteriales bacterium]|nr:MarR family transcriptional regulator [Mycobacteriales bacterium]
MPLGKPPAHPRRDLAALIVPLGRTLMAAEQPILQRHGIAMWAYAVLLALDSGDEPVRTQAALAQAIGADKTRIISVLDDLQERGLIRREPDPEDRRARVLAITPSGRKLRHAVQTEIQAQEERALARLPAHDRAAFLRTLETLTDMEPAEWQR